MLKMDQYSRTRVQRFYITYKADARCEKDCSKDYWSKDDLIRTLFFRKVLSLNRSANIMILAF